MQPIGSFTLENGIYSGTVKTVLHSFKARLVPIDRSSDQAPDYRALANGVEIGAGWKKTTDAGKDFISVKLDDPSFPNPIYASLFAADDPGTYTLLWSRPRGT